MKVAAVETIRVDHGRALRWLFVRVVSDSGLAGLGEASDSMADELTAHVVTSHFAPRILGRQVDPVALASRLRRVGTHPLSRPIAGLPLVTAASAIEQAMWDLAAREQGVPLWHLLGDRLLDAVPLYVNINRGLRGRTPDDFADAARAATEEGFGAVKCAPFDEVSEGSCAWRPGVERVCAIREAVGPGVRLLVDCHGRFDRGCALDVVRALEPCGLEWLEEPLLWEDDPEGLRAVRESAGMPIAAGELLYGSGAYRRMLRDEAVDVAMTDVKHCGGVSEARAIAGVCRDAGVPLSLHNPAGPVGTMHSVHVAASTPGVTLLELQQSPARTQLVREVAPGAEQVRDGVLLVPDAPGIGIDPAGVAGAGPATRVDA